MSGCRESNSVFTLPKRVYYRYTTPRINCGLTNPGLEHYTKYDSKME